MEATNKPLVEFIRKADTDNIVPFGLNVAAVLASAANADKYINGMKQLTGADEIEWTSTFEQAVNNKVFYTIVPTDTDARYAVTKIVFVDDLETVYLKDHDTIRKVFAESGDVIFATEDEAKASIRVRLADDLETEIAALSLIRDELNSRIDNLEATKDKYTVVDGMPAGTAPDRSVPVSDDASDADDDADDFGSDL